MTEHVFCQDALTQTGNLNLIIYYMNLFFLWGGNREQLSDARQPEGEVPFFLSIYLHANKFVFTKCLYSHHKTRFA